MSHRDLPRRTAPAPPPAALDLICVSSPLIWQLEEVMLAAKEQLEKQQAVVNALKEQGVPKDLVKKGQAKLAAARAYVYMIEKSAGTPLEVDFQGLRAAIARAKKLTAEVRLPPPRPHAPILATQLPPRRS